MKTFDPPPDSFDAAHPENWRELPAPPFTPNAPTAIDKLAVQPTACAFCGKDRREVGQLVSAVTASVAICDECVVVTIQILAPALGVVPSQVYVTLYRRQREAQIAYARKVLKAQREAAEAVDTTDNGIVVLPQ
jgi:hypothetical protein